MARQKRVLAISSGGGHWVQLTRVLPAFEECELNLACVDASYGAGLPYRFFTFNDATRWNKLGLVRQALRIARILLRVRPDVVISTGASPGYFAIRLGRWMGAKTIWLDSIANVDELSLSGQKVGKHAHLWLTQWPHLAGPDGPSYGGSVL